MEVRELVTLQEVRAAKPEMIFYANTCWWTHDANHLRVNGRFGPPPAGEAKDTPSIVPYTENRRVRVNPGGIPTDPRGGVLFQTDDIEGFLKSAEENISHYGKHGLRAFLAAHHANSYLSEQEPRPWCSPDWKDYNDALDRLDLRNQEKN